MNHSYSFYQNTFAGSIVNKINDVANGACEFIEIIVDRFIASVLAVLVYIYALYIVNTQLSLLIGGFSIVYLGIALWQSKISRGLFEKLWEYNSKLTGKVVDILSNISSVRFFTSQRYENRNINFWTTQKANLEKKLDIFF